MSCGLCLPHCPTWRVSGEETASPRGRIAAMRLVDGGDAPVDDTFVGYMDACVQCRGCETACPSSVPFGRLMAGTKASLAPARLGWRRHALPRPGAPPHVARVLDTARGRAAGPARAEAAGPARAARVPPAVAGRLGRTRPTSCLFTGCVMDAWQRPVHEATVRVMRATGALVAVVGRRLLRRAARARRALPPGTSPRGPGDGVDAFLAADRGRLGRLRCRAEGTACSARACSTCTTWLAVHSGWPAAGPAARRRLVAVQDPCHLRHVQRAHQHVRTVLRPYVDLVELDDDGLCCGAGGAYCRLPPGRGRRDP